MFDHFDMHDSGDKELREVPRQVQLISESISALQRQGFSLVTKASRDIIHCPNCKQSIRHIPYIDKQGTIKEVCMKCLRFYYGQD